MVELEKLLSRARAAWPGVRLDEVVFAEHLERVAPEQGDDDALHVADLYLACGCARGDAAAIRSFEQHVMPGARRAVARVDADPAFVDEVCSDVRVRLLTGEPPRIARYLGHGPLLHWVQVTAMRIGHSRKRRAGRQHFTALDDMVDSRADPELAPLAEQLRAPFGNAFTAALAELSARERNVLRLYLIDEISAEEIGTMYRVHRATVARWIAAARRKVYSATRKRLATTAGIEQGSFDSLMGYALSGLDLSLASFLDERSDG